MSQQTKAEDFRALHEGEPFVIPNPWDAGSARCWPRWLQGARHHELRLRVHARAADGGVTLDEVMEHTARSRGPPTAGVGRPRERRRGGPRTPRRDHARRGSGGRRRLDRGLGPEARHLRHHTPTERAAAAEAARRSVPVHAHRARGKPHPKNPDLDDTIARLQAYERRRRRAVRAGLRTPRRSAPSATSISQAGERPRPPRHDGARDRGPAPSGSVWVASSPWVATRRLSRKAAERSATRATSRPSMYGSR